LHQKHQNEYFQCLEDAIIISYVKQESHKNGPKNNIFGLLTSTHTPCPAQIIT